MRKSVCLFGILALCQLSLGNKLVRSERPGECPKPSQALGTCMVDPEKSCTDDNGCAVGSKCCPEQCGRICKPINIASHKLPIPPPPKPKAKPGQCPPDSGSLGICTFDPARKNCLGDEECGGDLKCCMEACGKTCKVPVQVSPVGNAYKPENAPSTAADEYSKPGQCPAPTGSFGICTFDPKTNCVGDKQCDGDKKCCVEGCNRICKAPVQVSPVPATPVKPVPVAPTKPEQYQQQATKPGQCPPSSGLAGICVFDPNRNCIADEECDGEKKCCSEGCGRECKTPVQY